MTRGVAWTALVAVVGCSALPSEVTTETAGVSNGDAAASGTMTGSGSTIADETASAGDPDAMCGDGLIGLSEDCDDANDSEIDGCTQSCQFSPVGAAMLEPSSETDVVGGVDDAGSVAAIDPCPQGQGLQGFTGTIDDQAFDQSGVVGRLTGQCATLDLVDDDPTALVFGPGTTLPTHGERGSREFSLMCPPGQLVAGLRGRAGGVIDQLRIACRSLEVEGQGSEQTIVVATGQGDGPAGGDGGQSFGAVECGDGQVAASIEVHANDFVLRVGLKCWTPRLVYP
ncbi:MAG: DUF4215 domain-containing protein [Deltaproteobacteria bacterium]|nr:DUF4215 domain-containing protein [Deltaproteobacteria bacterium]